MKMTEQQVEMITQLISYALIQMGLPTREIVCLLFDGASNDVISTVDKEVTIKALESCLNSYKEA